MKKILLIRHAKSSWKNADLDDFDRPLNKRGMRDAPFMGKILKKMGIFPEIILSSPAVRASSTAQIIAHELGYPVDEVQYVENLYLAGERDILNIINAVDDKRSFIAIVGHNPGFTSILNYLANENISNVPTCGMALLEFNAASWKEISMGLASMKFFEYPKKYF